MQELEETIDKDLDQVELADDPIKHLLYGYMFHYNPYRSSWRAFKREDNVRYFNGDLSEDELYIHEDISELVDIVVKEAAKSSN